MHRGNHLTWINQLGITMFKLITPTLSAAAVFVLMAAPVHADENTDKVVAKMAEGDVSAICQGGRETITAASSEATRALAQSGQIRGDFKAIGQAAGGQFYKEKCS